MRPAAGGARSLAWKQSAEGATHGRGGPWGRGERGPARRGLLGRQRERRRGGTRPAGPVPSRRPSAAPLAALWSQRRTLRHPSRLVAVMTKAPEQLRSYRWFGRSRTEALRALSHRGARIPAIYVTAGPMLRGSYRGQPPAAAPTCGGSGTASRP